MTASATRRARCAAAAAILTAVAVGCGPRSPATGVATGRVTFAGRPVGNGTIAFLPVDGAGPTAGGIIENGAYRVEQLHPGTKLVRIEAFEQRVAFPRSSADMEREAATRKRRPPPSEPLADPNVIPADAVGNNVEVTITTGPQALDFDLQPRPATGARSD